MAGHRTWLVGSLINFCLPPSQQNVSFFHKEYTFSNNVPCQWTGDFGIALCELPVAQFSK